MSWTNHLVYWIHDVSSSVSSIPCKHRTEKTDYDLGISTFSVYFRNLRLRANNVYNDWFLAKTSNQRPRNQGHLPKLSKLVNESSIFQAFHRSCETGSTFSQFRSASKLDSVHLTSTDLIPWRKSVGSSEMSAYSCSIHPSPINSNWINITYGTLQLD